MQQLLLQFRPAPGPTHALQTGQLQKAQQLLPVEQRHFRDRHRYYHKTRVLAQKEEELHPSAISMHSP